MGMCAYIFVQTSMQTCGVDMSVEVGVEMCAGMSTERCRDGSVDMKVDVGVDMCTEMSDEIWPRSVCAHVYIHAYEHVYRHVYRRVQRHAYRNVHRLLKRLICHN